MEEKDTLREVDLMEMLDARDRRVRHQEELQSRYPACTLLCFTMNIAGPVKNSPLIRRGFLHGCALIREQLLRIRREPVFSEICDAPPTGPESYFVLDLPPLTVKRLTAELEEQDLLGRLFDMDVLDSAGEKLDRSLLGLPPRTCLLCGQVAKACARSRTHTVPDLQKRTRLLLQASARKEDLDTIAYNACRALLYEVCTTPKPGLVDRFNSGSHRDMDIFTFMDSAAALQPYFRICGEVGMDTRNEEPAETFRRIRQCGCAAERTMLSATGGVNTHKGAIFSMGIACAALGRLDRTHWAEPETVLAECGRIAAGVTAADLGTSAAPSLTTGEKLYRQYGIRGVRGQAEDGFPAVLYAGLPVLEREYASHGDLNRAGSVAMLYLLCADTDTNLIARGGREMQLSVTAQIRELLETDQSPSEETIAAMDQQFIEKNLSPGGSADLLGLCYLLHFLKTEGGRS